MKEPSTSAPGAGSESLTDKKEHAVSRCWGAMTRVHYERAQHIRAWRGHVHTLRSYQEEIVRDTTDRQGLKLAVLLRHVVSNGTAATKPSWSTISVPWVRPYDSAALTTVGAGPDDDAAPCAPRDGNSRITDVNSHRNWSRPRWCRRAEWRRRQ